MATFDENSVNTDVNTITKNKQTSGGKTLKFCSEFPRYSDIPDLLAPSAKANPPPSKNNSPHGILEFITFHVNKPVLFFFGRSAKRKPKIKN